MTISIGVRPEDHYRLVVYDSLDRALDQDLTAVYITNPISMHVSTAIRAAEAGHNLFIEKPLGSSLDGIDRLAGLIANKRLVTMVGYQLRFHPALARIGTLIHEGEIGFVVAADVHFGEWLPGMHPYEDYRESHAARRDQGGGAILCLSHEIDYALSLFGRPNRVCATGGHLSSLEIDVEDTAEILFDCEDNGRRVPVHVHLDFVARPPRRYCHVIGDRGAIHWDYYRNVVEIWRDGEREPVAEAFPGFQRNDMFVSEVTNFLDSIRAWQPSAVSLEDGIQTLKVCLAARSAMERGCEVRL